MAELQLKWYGTCTEEALKRLRGLQNFELPIDIKFSSSPMHATYIPIGLRNGL